MFVATCNSSDDYEQGAYKVTVRELQMADWGNRLLVIVSVE